MFVMYTDIAAILAFYLQPTQYGTRSHFSLLSRVPILRGAPPKSDLGPAIESADRMYIEASKGLIGR